MASFGAPQNNNSVPSFFGTAAKPSTPLFGGQQASTSGTAPLFGAPPATQQQGQTGQTQSLFGQQQPAAGTGQTQPNIFGQPAAPAPAQGATTSLFGQPAANTGTGTASTSLFGQPQQGGTTATPNIFGQQPAAGTTNSTTSLFGQPAANNSSTGTTSLFGQPNATNPAPSTSLFGQPQQQQQQQQSSTPLFGQTQPQTNSLFGQNQNQQRPANSLFGQPAQQQQSQQPTNSLFGAGQSQQTLGAPTSSLFGAGPTNNTNLGASVLGTSTLGGSLLPTRGPASANQGGVTAQEQFEVLKRRIEGVALAWNSGSSECRFQHYFYNLVDPHQVNLYGRPPNATNEALWQKAQRENPDPKCMVPVLAVGFDDLKQRVDAQMRQAEEHQKKLDELKARFKDLTTRHSVSNSTRLARASSTQTQLTHRLMSFIQHLHLLIPALRSSAIRPEEEELRRLLEAIEEVLRGGGGGGFGSAGAGAGGGGGNNGRAKGKLNELWALVGALNAAKERGGSGRDGMDGEGREQWAIVDEDGLAQITQILREQQAGLGHLTKILQRDLKDLATITGVPTDSNMEDHGMGSFATGGYGGGDSGDGMRGSMASTLRVSSLR